MQDLQQVIEHRGFGSLFDLPDAGLPYPPPSLPCQSFSYYSSWAWAFSMGIPCPFPTHNRLFVSFGQPRFCTDTIWSYRPSDSFLPVAYLLLTEPVDPVWARRLCPLLGEI